MPPKIVRLEPRFSFRLVQPFLAALEQLTPQATPVMRDLRRADVDDRLPVSGALRLLEAAVALTGREDLGLLAADALRYGSCDVLFFAGASAPTWGAAIDNILRYVRIVNEAAQFKLEVRGAVASIELHTSLQMNRVASDFQVASLARAARAWVQDLSTFEFWLSCPAPHDTGAYEARFGPGAIRFGTPIDAITFDARLLLAPVSSSDPALHDMVRRHADGLLRELPEATSFIPRVRSAVMELLANADADAPHVARRLGMSRRTLSRCLEREGVTFSELLDKVRHELALTYLLKTEYDIQEIAFLLGYSLTGAFSRAFRRWEDRSPQAYRQAERGALSLG